MRWAVLAVRLRPPPGCRPGLEALLSASGFVLSHTLSHIWAWYLMLQGDEAWKRDGALRQRKQEVIRKVAKDGRGNLPPQGGRKSDGGGGCAGGRSRARGRGGAMTARLARPDGGGEVEGTLDNREGEDADGARGRLDAGDDDPREMKEIGLSDNSSPRLADRASDRRGKLMDVLRLFDPTATVHGMRATFKTWASDAGFPREVIEMALGHTVGTAVEQATSGPTCSLGGWRSWKHGRPTARARSRATSASCGRDARGRKKVLAHVGDGRLSRLTTLLGFCQQTGARS